MYTHMHARVNIIQLQKGECPAIYYIIDEPWAHYAKWISPIEKGK